MKKVAIIFLHMLHDLRPKSLFYWNRSGLLVCSSFTWWNDTTKQVTLLTGDTTKQVTLLTGRGRSACVQYICRRWSMLFKWMTVEMSVSTWNMSRILHDDPKLDAYWYCISQMLTPKLREFHRSRSTALLQWFKEKKYHKHPLHRREDFFYPGKIKSSQW